jgi:hypothetical protein
MMYMVIQAAVSIRGTRMWNMPISGHITLYATGSYSNKILYNGRKIIFYLRLLQSTYELHYRFEADTRVNVI